MFAKIGQATSLNDLEEIGVLPGNRQVAHLHTQVVLTTVVVVTLVVTLAVTTEAAIVVAAAAAIVTVIDSKWRLMTFMCHV